MQCSTTCIRLAYEEDGGGVVGGEIMRVSGFSATVIWADGEIVIEHHGAAQRLGAPPWIQIPEGLVTGVVVQEPTLVRNGMLQFRVRGIDHQPMEPGDPFTVVFTRRSVGAFRELQERIETTATT